MASARVNVGHLSQHGGRCHMRATYSRQMVSETSSPSGDSTGGWAGWYRASSSPGTSRYGALIARAAVWQKAHFVTKSSRYVRWKSAGYPETSTVVAPRSLAIMAGGPEAEAARGQASAARQAY